MFLSSDTSLMALWTSELSVAFPEARATLKVRFSPFPFAPKCGESHIKSTGAFGGSGLAVQPFGGTNEGGRVVNAARSSEITVSIIAEFDGCEKSPSSN